MIAIVAEKKGIEVDTSVTIDGFVVDVLEELMHGTIKALDKLDVSMKGDIELFTLSEKIAFFALLLNSKMNEIERSERDENNRQ